MVLGRCLANRAHGLRERRSFWVLRLESIGFVLLSAIAMLVVAFLVVLGPLLFKAAAAYVPALAPLESHDFAEDCEPDRQIIPKMIERFASGIFGPHTRA